jgi:S1-C subfamily serine protease
LLAALSVAAALVTACGRTHRPPEAPPPSPTDEEPIDSGAPSASTDEAVTGGEGGEGGAAAGGPGGSSAAGGGGGVAEPIADEAHAIAALRKTSPTDTQLPQGVFDWMVAHKGALRHELHLALPQSKKSQGIKVLGVKKGSLFEAGGLEDGDILHNLNGRDLDSPENVMDAYTDALTASKWVLEVIRKGKPITFTYVLVR